MTDDLEKKLNTAGAFDSPWLKEQLRNWDTKTEQKKANFMEHMYQCSGRANGLVEYFRRVEFVKDLEAGKFEGQEVILS